MTYLNLAGHSPRKSSPPKRTVLNENKLKQFKTNKRILNDKECLDDDQKNFHQYKSAINSFGRKRTSSNLIIQKQSAADELDKQNLLLSELNDSKNEDDKKFLAPEYEYIGVERFKKKRTYIESELDDTLF